MGGKLEREREKRKRERWLGRKKQLGSTRRYRDRGNRDGQGA